MRLLKFSSIIVLAIVISWHRGDVSAGKGKIASKIAQFFSKHKSKFVKIKKGALSALKSGG